MYNDSELCEHGESYKPYESSVPIFIGSSPQRIWNDPYPCETCERFTLMNHVNLMSPDEPCQPYESNEPHHRQLVNVTINMNMNQNFVCSANQK